MGHGQSVLRKEQAAAERRGGPRLDTDLTVTVIGPDGYSVNTHLVNICQGGISIVPDREAGLRILWAHQVSTGRTVDVRFDLPVADGTGSDTVEARCKIMWSKPAAHDGWQLGLRLIDYSSRSAKILEHYIVACQRNS